jgi:hypothetical protein
VRADCKGHVVRVESQPDGRGFMMVVHLDRFEFVRFRKEAPP